MTVTLVKNKVYTNGYRVAHEEPVFEECFYDCDLPEEEPVFPVYIECELTKGGETQFLYLCKGCVGSADDAVCSKSESNYESSMSDYYGGGHSTLEHQMEQAKKLK